MSAETNETHLGMGLMQLVLSNYLDVLANTGRAREKWRKMGWRPVCIFYSDQAYSRLRGARDFPSVMMNQKST